MQLRVPVYDLVTAVDLMTTGKYQRLPLCMSRALPRKPEPDLQAKALTALTGNIRTEVKGLDLPLVVG